MANRRDLLKLAAAPAFLTWAAEAANLPSSVVEKPGATVKHDPFGETRIYFEGSTDQLKSMTAGSLLLKPGMEPHPPHQHPEEEFMTIAEGQAEIIVDGKRSLVGPGGFMYCAGNQIHGIHNPGPKPMLFYFYKWKA
jgi:quercetin dioxygenase-like cupin family protein